MILLFDSSWEPSWTIWKELWYINLILSSLENSDFQSSESASDGGSAGTHLNKIAAFAFVSVRASRGWKAMVVTQGTISKQQMQFAKNIHVVFKCKAWDIFPTKWGGVCLCMFKGGYVHVIHLGALYWVVPLWFFFLIKLTFCHVGCSFLVLSVTQVGHQGFLEEKIYGSPEIFVYVSIYNNVAHYSSSPLELHLMGVVKWRTGVSVLGQNSQIWGDHCARPCAMLPWVWLTLSLLWPQREPDAMQVSFSSLQGGNPFCALPPWTWAFAFWFPAEVQSNQLSPQQTSSATRRMCNPLTKA